jgi:hypothetical protein
VLVKQEFLSHLFLKILHILTSQTIKDEAKNLHSPKLSVWFAHLLLSARANAILLQFFCERWFCILLKIKRHNFHEASSENAACYLPLFFRGATVKASALPKFFASPCNLSNDQKKHPKLSRIYLTTARFRKLCNNPAKKIANHLHFIQQKKTNPNKQEFQYINKEFVEAESRALGLRRPLPSIGPTTTTWRQKLARLQKRNTKWARTDRTWQALCLLGKRVDRQSFASSFE